MTKQNETMSYSRACEILKFTTPKSLRANEELAASRLDKMADTAPLREAAACHVLVGAAR